VNSGTEATETAMKIAIQHFQEKGMKGKQKIISRWMSYHGITVGALSMSGHPLRRQRFVSLLEDYPTLSPPYCFRCPVHLSYPTCKIACATQLEAAIENIGPEQIAAFIAEPIIGAAGAAITPPLEYYKIIKDMCEYYNILFIADEVMTGMGRTGKWFAMEHWDVTPDIMTLGKGLTAGYTPMAAVMVSDAVMEPIVQGSKSIMSGHTFSANPLSAAVSLAVVEYIEKHGLVEAAAKKGRYLQEKLRALQQQFACIADVRGKGLLFGLELHVPNSSLIAAAMQHGLLLYPAVAGRNGKSETAVLIAPPLTISDSELDEMLMLLQISLQEVTL
jgi:adenosylmethionine-8-amino-7-oxononanoate aminotransferase